MIYCDFFPNQNGIDVLLLFKFKIVNFIVLLFSFKRQTEMDRVRRRQIDARPFLRPAGKFQFTPGIIPFDLAVVNEGNARKRHEFDVGDIHGPTTGNLLLPPMSRAKIQWPIYALVECDSLMQTTESLAVDTGTVQDSEPHHRSTLN